MNAEYYTKLCEARDTLCGFCEVGECDKCIVNCLIDDAYNELSEKGQAEINGEYYEEDWSK